MRIKNKVISLSIVFVLILGVFSYPASAAGEGELSDAQKAVQFVEAVEAIEYMTDIEQKYQAIEIAYSDVVFFDDVSYEGVAEALEKLEQLRVSTDATIAKCQEFLEKVDLLISAYEIGYAETKALLKSIEEIYQYVDFTYSAVIDANNSYNVIKSEISGKEKYMQSFLDEVKKLETATNYLEKSQISKNIDMFFNSDEFIYEFEGVDEALEILDELEEYFKECLLEATMFKMATDAAALATATEFKALLIDCMPYLDTVDLTVDVAKEAKNVFDRLLGQYKAVARTVNSIMVD